LSYLVFFSSAQAQTEIDSLLALLKTTPRDTNRINLYADISWAYAISRTHPGLARQYADSIRSLATELNNEKGVAEADFYYGTAARYAGNHAQAIPHFQRYVDYNRLRGDSARLGRGLYQLAVTHSILGDYEKSLAAYYRILPIYQKLGNRRGVAVATMGIGIQFENRRKFGEAIEAYRKAQIIFDSLDNKTHQVDVRVNLANAYVATQRYDTARLYYEQALRLDQELGNEWGVATDLCSIGIMFNQLQQPDSAMVYHRRALLMRQRIPQKNELAISLYHVGYTHLLLKQYDRARQYLKQALSLAQEVKAKPLVRDAYEKLAALYAQKKDFSRAYVYSQWFTTLKDSILNEESSRQLSELQIKYETSEKDKRITLLAKETEIQRQEVQRQATVKKALLFGLALMTILTFLLIYIFRQRLRHQQQLTAKNEEIQEAKFKQQLSELEMKALRAQINPHFLFNCLNSINRMVLDRDTESASRYITKFARFIRLILENSENTSVSLQNELMMLESYIQLENLRLKGRIRYEIRVDEAIDQENTFLPSMVLQPFVENAIWHGLMHKPGEEPGFIRIGIEEQEDQLTCVIEDNGVGREKAFTFKEKTIVGSKSMGLQLTEERLRLLNKGRLERLIHITDLKDSLNQALGTRVDIHIPLI